MGMKWDKRASLRHYNFLIYLRSQYINLRIFVKYNLLSLEKNKKSYEIYQSKWLGNSHKKKILKILQRNEVKICN
jgi:hypothetical protein